MSTESTKAEAARLAQKGTMWTERHYRNFIVYPGIDIGYRGYVDAKPMWDFQGLDLGHPGYDGHTIPYTDQTYMTVHASHALEHYKQPVRALREWFRILCISGHMIITVPHKYLYEKREALPSRWNEDHKRFYTPASLLSEIELALEPNTYRVIYCRDNDYGFDYSIGPDKHSGGCYEIECILQRIQPPTWSIA